MSLRNKRFIIEGSLLMSIGCATPLLNQDVVEVNHNVALWLINILLMMLDCHRRVILAESLIIDALSFIFAHSLT